MKKLVLFSTAVLLIPVSHVTGVEINRTKQIAPDKQSLFRTQLSGSQFSLQAQVNHHGGELNIIGPDGFQLTRKITDSALTVNLSDGTKALSPGTYFYEISTTVGSKRLITDTINNGRGEKNHTYAGSPVKQTGRFIVADGAIVDFAQTDEVGTNEW